VWRADNYDVSTESGGGLDAAPWWSSDLAHQVTVGDSTARPVNEAAKAWDQWWQEISLLGGVSPLIQFQDRGENRIDISRGHPGGLARFLAGSPTLLSNLIRDDVARRPATLAALRLADHAHELANTRGLSSMALGIGLVEWHHEGVDYCGPLLMRSVHLRRRGGDIELTLKQSHVVLNPGLQRAFAEQLKVTLDASAFVALTNDEGAFKPNPALDRLRDLTAHRGDVAVSARLIVSSFAQVSEPMLEDARNLQHSIVDALGGNTHAMAQLRAARVPVEITHPDSRPASSDRSIVDLDAEQDAIVANILAGNSVAVRAFPGTGSTQVAAGALGGLVAANKRVLVVSAQAATTAGLMDRISGAGLKGMVARVASPRSELIASLSRNEKVKKPSLTDVDSAWERLRKIILRYRQALAAKDPELGVSAAECFQRLGKLSLGDHPPETTARLERDALVALAPGLGQAAEMLARAARLGEFKFGPEDTPWFGVNFRDVDDAKKSYERAQRLSAESLPSLIEKIGPILAATPLPTPTTVGQMVVFVHLLVDLRDTLDRFQPSVFDRSLTDLIRATGPSDEASEMPRVQRRRLKGLAREYVRPGVYVGDLHESLVNISTQREIWNRHVETGHRPSVPGGLSDAHVVLQQVEHDLGDLERVLRHTADGRRLSDMPTQDLLDLLGRLSTESEILHSLEARQEVSDHLGNWNLGPLVEDLASRHVDAADVARELELAWWRGALEQILEREEALLGSDKAILERLEADFRLVDEAHCAGNGQAVAWQLSERWSLGLMDWPEEAVALKKLLKASQTSARELSDQAPHLVKSLAPVWLATPYNVHEIPDTVRFDTVIVLDAGALAVGEVLGAVRRAPQLVAMGDPVTQTPTAFSLGLRSHEISERNDRDAQHQESLFARLRDLLPTFSLTRSYRVSGDDLSSVVNSSFLGEQVRSLPWAGSFLGHPAIAVDLVEDGQGMPDVTTGLVEGVESEVRVVLQHVMDHAMVRSAESLMVITASALHARKVREAVAQAMARKPDITDFFTRDSSEPFVVTTLEQAGSLIRDRVVFSLGYGRTPHGRVLSDLGPLSQPGGERLLAAVFTSARRHLRVVTCVAVGDLHDARLSRTTRALGDVLERVSAARFVPVEKKERDPLLVDLATRLEAKGMRVEVDYQGQIPLAASFGGYCIALDTDTSLMYQSVRDALRVRPLGLAAAGWHYVRAHALELFTTPDLVAERIATLVGASSAPRDTAGENV
jgi:hypothetical protein